MISESEHVHRRGTRIRCDRTSKIDKLDDAWDDVVARAARLST